MKESRDKKKERKDARRKTYKLNSKGGQNRRNTGSPVFLEGFGPGHRIPLLPN
jgi:hypothetical protein